MKLSQTEVSGESVGVGPWHSAVKLSQTEVNDKSVEGGGGSQHRIVHAMWDH